MGLECFIVSLSRFYSHKISRVIGVSVGFSLLLSGCSTQNCDPTGAMAAHCKPLTPYVFTGEAFEEDKMFYYRTQVQIMERLRRTPATELTNQALKGQKDYHIMTSEDGQKQTVIFLQRPASF